MKLVFEFFVKIIEDNSLFPQTVNNKFKLLINSNSLIEFLVSFIKSVLEYFDLLL